MESERPHAGAKEHRHEAYGDRQLEELVYPEAGCDRVTGCPQSRENQDQHHAATSTSGELEQGG